MAPMPRINELWAWVATDEDSDDEGVMAAYNPNMGGWVPLIGADRDRIESYRELVTDMAQGKPIRLIRYLNREVIEEVNTTPDNPEYMTV